MTTNWNDVLGNSDTSWGNVLGDTDTNWSVGLERPSNDLEKVETNESEVLQDDEGNDLLMHTGNYTFIEGEQTWENIF